MTLFPNLHKKPEEEASQPAPSSLRENIDPSLHQPFADESVVSMPTPTPTLVTVDPFAEELKLLDERFDVDPTGLDATIIYQEQENDE